MIIIVTAISNFYCTERNGRNMNTVEGLFIHKTEYETFTDKKEELVYFVDDNDTLNFFCIFNKNSKNEKYSVRVSFDEEIKRSFSETDTAVVSDVIYDKRMYRNISYKQQIHLLDLFINKFIDNGKKFDISYIQYKMINSGTANVEITNEYNKYRGKKALSSILQNSCLRYDIDSILAPHHLKTSNMFVADNIYFFQPKESFLNINIINDSKSVPDSLLEFYAIINISKLNVLK